MIKISGVDQYLTDGCGRCKLFATPYCKVHKWHDVLIELRALLQNTTLKEEIKWGMPCYTLNGKNVIMLVAFKEYSAINFLKGNLLKDNEMVLTKAGENTQSARVVKFMDHQQVVELRIMLAEYIAEAIEIEKSGIKSKVVKPQNQIPAELLEAFKHNPELKVAFDSLTPGRQRGYLLYFTAPKQSKTKFDRINKMTPKILSGLGLNDCS